MTTTSTPDTITLTTEEGHEVTLAQADYRVLKAWPFLDITRLVVVGEDAVHGRMKDGTIHPSSLETLLSLVHVPTPAPKVPEPTVNPPAPPVTLLDSKGRQTTPEALARAAANTARSAKDRAAREAKRLSGMGDMLALVGKTGETKPDSLLLKPQGRKSLPTVVVDGVPALVTQSFIEGDRVKVPVIRRPHNTVVAWGYISAATHQMLRYAPGQPRMLVWSQDDQGRPTTCYRGSNAPVLVTDLLHRLGLDPAVLEMVPVVEPVEA